MTKAAHHSLRFVWRNLAVVALIIASYVAVTAWINNNDRINDIQHSRFESCSNTYEGVRKVFKPFFHAKSQRTEKEQVGIDKFNHTIDDLKLGCLRQTSTGGP